MTVFLMTVFLLCWRMTLSGDRINDLFCALKGKDVRFIAEVKYTLEKYFREKLGRNKEEASNAQ